MNECNPVGTPIILGEDKTFDTSNEKIEVESYQETIGELLYIANPISAGHCVRYIIFISI